MEFRQMNGIIFRHDSFLDNSGWTVVQMWFDMICTVSAQSSQRYYKYFEKLNLFIGIS